VPQVVREKKIHYQRVPRLGSYMAIPLTYKHCLTDSALDEATNDHKDVMARRDELEREKKAHEDEQAARKTEAIANEQTYEEEEREWPEIGFAEYSTTQEKLVVCLDTMGQDRDFSDEERRFALKTIARFIEIWEAEQRSNLTKDRDERLAVMAPPPVSETPIPTEKEGSENENEPKLNPFEEIEKAIEDHFAANDEPDDEKKDFKAKQLRLQKTGAMFQTNEAWKAELQSLTKMKVLKLPRVLQSIYYLNCFTKAQITLPNS
jgi:cation transport regulator ChaB